jgi:hypothetical protein
MQTVVSVWDAMWRNKMRRCWAHADFTSFGLRNRAMDLFFQRILKDADPKLNLGMPIVGYGDAHFLPAMRGAGRAVPTSKTRKKCAQHMGKANITDVDEFRTTLMCPFCGKPTAEVKEPERKRSDKKTKGGVEEETKDGVEEETKDGVEEETKDGVKQKQKEEERLVKVRGLRLCDNTECLKLLHRDRSAALNMLGVLKYQRKYGRPSRPKPRPTQLSRGEPRTEPRKPFVLHYSGPRHRSGDHVWCGARS